MNAPHTHHATALKELHDLDMHGVELIQAAQPLLLSHRTCGLSAEVALHGDALRIDRPRELTAESSGAIVRKSSDQLIGGSNKNLQGRVCTRACRLKTQSAIAGLVFGSRN